MRWSIILLLVLFLVGFGCLEDKGFEGSKTEQIVSTDTVDLDGDGNFDYAVYSFAPVTMNESEMIVQRQITVSVTTTAEYTTQTQNLTDVDLLLVDQNLEEFSKLRTQSDSVCSQTIGLYRFACSDVSVCTKLCSDASVRCRKISGTYPEALADSMLGYAQDNNEIEPILVDARRTVFTLKNANLQEKNVFLLKTRRIIGEIANINANPLYTNADLKLCSPSNFGLSYVIDAAQKFGTYTTADSSYTYHVLLSVKPVQKNQSSQVGVEMLGVGLSDRLPNAVIGQTDQISSTQTFSTTENPDSLIISWNSTKSNKDGYLFYYTFASNSSPGNLLPSLKTPDLRVKKANMLFLMPTNSLLSTANGIVKNYYIAYGLALGITIATLLIIYNFMVLILGIISERAAGASFTAGFRKAFGKTEVKWKTDIIIAFITLAGGYYVSSVMARQPTTSPQILDSIDLLMRSDLGVVGIMLTTIGVAMLYFAVENFLKIIILEKVYGMVIRQERDLFIAKAAALKDRLKELEILVEEYTKEDFDVSKEYDALNTVKAEKIDTLAKEMTARSKALIEEYSARVENATNSLKERKKIADDNWPKWKESIGKMLEDQSEVYTSSLLTIPASLRTWALGKYAREVGMEAISFERDALKKRKVSPNQLVQEMVEKGILKGALILKQDKVTLSEFADGGSTIMTALSMKMIGYLRSLSKNLGQHSAQSFVAIGEKSVIVMLRNRTFDSILFITKDKFKDAIEQWKAKTKLFEAA